MELLSCRGLTKYFPETKTLADNNVSLSLEAGETRAVVGENGAGKSSLARIIAGLAAADSGEIRVRGARLRGGSVREAEAAGIGFVPQVSLLASGLSVAENIVLGREPRSLGLFLSRRKAYVEAALLIERFGFRLSPDAIVSSLSAAECRQVEIARALARGGDVLILDEPTSILSESESESLFGLLSGLAKSGKGIILITHRIAEVKKVADTITVLREGSVVAEGSIDSFDEESLAGFMARRPSPARTFYSKGREEVEGSGGERSGSTTVLEIDGLILAPGACPVSLTVSRGEVLGVAALAGNGLGRLEDYASGMAIARNGEIRVAGKNLDSIPREELRAKSLAYIPSDREKRGLCLSSSLRDNALVLRRREFGFGDWLFPSRRDKAAKEASLPLGLAAEPFVPAASLSGGNRQRLVLARELVSPKSLLVLAEPLQGLDLASQAAVSALILELAARGSAVLLLTSNVEELIGMADRAIALYRGEIVFEGLNEGAATARGLLEAMTGLSSGSVA
jgi:general nucleoside transport system ATP-binding protein